MNLRIAASALIPAIALSGGGCAKKVDGAVVERPPFQANGPNGPGGAGGPLDRMVQDLGLTDAQKKRLEEIDQSIPRPQPGRTPTQADMESMRKAFEERRSKIESILTPEQKSKFEAMRSQGPMGGPPPGGMPPGEMGPGGPPSGDPPSDPGGTTK